MKTTIYIIIFILFTFCNSYDSSLIKDPRYSSGLDYETKKPLVPQMTFFDDYTFISGYSDTSATLGMYFKNKEINFWTSADGFFDTIMKVNLNSDNIPDFIFENIFEDESSLYALISQTNTDFQKKKITDNYDGSICIESLDTLKYLYPITIKDINGNGKNEVLINLVKINGQLISISCTDTFYIDR